MRVARSRSHVLSPLRVRLSCRLIWALIFLVMAAVVFIIIYKARKSASS